MALPAAVGGVHRVMWCRRLQLTVKLQVPSVQGSSVAAGDRAQMKLESESQSL